MTKNKGNLRLRPEDQVLISLRQIIRATDLRSRQLVRDTGLTTPQLAVLRAIAAGDKPTASEVAHDVSLSQATVTIIVNRLEQRGLIERQRSSQDKRRIHLLLTDAGRQSQESAPQLLQENFLRRFAELESWEQYQLVSSLLRVAQMMDASDIDAAPILVSDFDLS